VWQLWNIHYVTPSSGSELFFAGTIFGRWFCGWFGGLVHQYPAAFVRVLGDCVLFASMKF
jgi:hypothetical protein